ncbi:MAG: class I SAM-dependent methyltransferase, partial [Planctomycetota bacterium]
MYALRREVRRRFPDPLGLPRTKRPEALIAAKLKPGVRIADVGSGDGTLEEKLDREGLKVDYVSIDPGGGADFASLAEAGGTFGAACLLEVVEHLDPDEGAELLAEVYGRLEKGGLLILSTPNIFKPGQFLK